jgi:hypothetical protein
MDFKSHLETAWNMTLKHIVNLILMTLVTLVVSFLTLGFLAPVVMAGYVQSIIMLMRDGREPKMEDLFSQMRLFLPLLGFSIGVCIAVMVGFLLFVLPGLAILLAITFGCLYMIPLMTDKQLSIVDAIKTSWKMAWDNSVADHIVVVILFIGLMAIGSSVFIGTLFTQPFATVFLVSVYLEKTAASEKVTPQAPPPPPENQSGD